jgi:hypothetical protein
VRPPLPEFPADASPTAQLMRRLFVDLGQSTGGPMHIVLEDGNVEDHSLDYCASDANMAYLSNGQLEQWAQAGDDVSDQHKQAIRDTCAEITALLRPMTEAQRRKAINEFWAWWAPNATAVMVEQAGGYDDEEDDEPDAGEDDIEPGPVGARPVHGPSWNAQLREEDQRPEEPKACVTIPCPSFEEVTLGGANWFEQMVPHIGAGGAPAVAGLHRWRGDWADLDGPLKGLRIEDMSAHAVPEPLRMQSGPPAVTAPVPQIPRIVVLPGHVTADQAERALVVCRDLGLLQDLPHGVLFLPAGVVS